MAEPGGPEGGGGGGEGDDVVECVVEFDYIAELNDELTLRVSSYLQFFSMYHVFLDQVGDVITCTSRPDGGWWKGILRGREGVFPDNFVKVGILNQRLINHSKHRKIKFLIDGACMHQPSFKKS